MKVLIVPDKFKGSLTAPEVCEVVAKGIRAVDRHTEIISIPMADGGEGTARMLTSLSKGNWVTVRVHDPLGREVNSGFGVSPDGREAYIDMASASGLSFLAPHERNPAYTSSVGAGELVIAAIAHGAQRMIVGIGGSATNDGGMGFATALGARFVDENGEPLPGRGCDLAKVRAIDISQLDSRIAQKEFVVLTDVSNPLAGPNGATHAFAAQKGASPNLISELEEGMVSYAKVIEETFGVKASFPGAGAAGGMGMAARIFLQASITSGARFLIKHAGIEKLIRESDLVISGEGKVDEQTFSGKVVSAVGELCHHHQKEFWVVAGVIMARPELERLGVRRAIALLPEAGDEESATRDASEILERLVRWNFLEFSSKAR